MLYSLIMQVPEDANPEYIADKLEKAAEQVREMSSIRAAHDMKQPGVKHGTLAAGSSVTVNQSTTTEA